MRDFNFKAKIIYIVLIAALLITCLLAPQSIQIAAAAETQYSDVLADLSKDATFNAANYPAIDDNFALSVISVAESEDKELFVYVYQPGSRVRKMVASSINISRTIDSTIKYKNYQLFLLNSSGVFYKYKVEDLIVSDEDVRYYEISSILRPFDKLVDKGIGGGNIVNDVSFAVNKRFGFTKDEDGKYSCSTLDIQTITITDKFVGFVRYPDGFRFWNEGACDSHFVAFDTDKPIDKLCEADVCWEQQHYLYSPNPPESWKNFGNPQYGEVEKKERTLSDEDDTVHYTGFGIKAGSYSWERIETVDEFISSVNTETDIYSGALISLQRATNITSEAMQALKGKKWVLRFAETEYQYGKQQDMQGNTVVARYDLENATLVGKVTILRLKFITDGKEYNLGVIDNKQTGSDKPVNNDDIVVKPGEVIQDIKDGWDKFKDQTKDFWNIVWKVLVGVAAVVVVVIVIVVIIKLVGLSKGKDKPKPKTKSKPKPKPKKKTTSKKKTTKKRK